MEPESGAADAAQSDHAHPVLRPGAGAVEAPEEKVMVGARVRVLPHVGDAYRAFRGKRGEVIGQVNAHAWLVRVATGRKGGGLTQTGTFHFSELEVANGTQ